MKANRHEGTIVSVSGHKLVMKGKKGKEMTHTIARDATVTIDGRKGDLDDRKPGMHIEVHTAKGDIKTVTKIEVRTKESRER